MKLATNSPKFIRFFSPVIEALKELGGSGSPSEVRDFIAKRLNVSEEERTELLKGDSLRLALPTTETEYEEIQPNLFIERIRLNFCILNPTYGKPYDSLPDAQVSRHFTVPSFAITQRRFTRFSRKGDRPSRHMAYL